MPPEWAKNPVRIEQAERVPGLYNVEFSDGSWLYDLTVGQVRAITDTVDPLHNQGNAQ